MAAAIVGGVATPIGTVWRFRRKPDLEALRTPERWSAPMPEAIAASAASTMLRRCFDRTAGDGPYGSYWGLDALDRPLQLVTDFALVA